MDGYDTSTGEINEQPVIVGERFASGQTAAVDAALVKAMEKLEPPKKTKTAKIKDGYSYSYAPIEEVIAACRAALPPQGLWFQQMIVDGGKGLRLRTIVYHKSGQWIGCDYPIFQAQNTAQGFASGVTYARRYSLQLALGIAGEDDDDGNVADGKPAEIASRGAGAQGNGAGTRAPPQRQQAAPAPSEAKADAEKRWKEIRAEIDACMTAVDVDAVLKMPAWASMEAAVRGVETQQTADAAIQTLIDRAANRRDMILRDADGR